MMQGTTESVVAAPDVTLARLNGGVAKLSDYRGRRLLVFMWGSW